MTARKPSKAKPTAKRKGARAAGKPQLLAPTIEHRSMRPARAPEKRDGSVLGPLLHLLCPWQLKYITDRSRFKKLKKSRRVGGTWIQALEDVLDAAETSGLDVWFTSADESAGIGYIEYVRMWAQALPLLIQIADVSLVPESDLVEVEFTKPEVLEVADDAEATASVVRFHNGSKITALTSSPRRLRSKGGKLVIDEFSHHKNDRELWKAGQPVALRGHSIRVLSTLNGKSCLFSKLGERPKDKGIWSVHQITLSQALAEGMMDQIAGRPTSVEEREQFRKECEASCATLADYLEEYECIEQDEGRALLPYHLIERAEREGILGLHQVKGPLYLGMDIGRVLDLTVIYILELCGQILYTRHLVVLQDVDFTEQGNILWELLRHPKMVRAAIDARGIGMHLAENAWKEFGAHRIDRVMATPAIKDALATRMIQEFQDTTVLIPVDEKQREGLHAVAKMVSITNSVRYDAKHDEENGHGDHFWALALALSAARTGDTGSADVMSRPTGSIADGISVMGASSSSLDKWAGMR